MNVTNFNSWIRKFDGLLLCRLMVISHLNPDLVSIHYLPLDVQGVNGLSRSLVIMTLSIGTGRDHRTDGKPGDSTTEEVPKCQWYSTYVCHAVGAIAGFKDTD